MVPMGPKLGWELLEELAGTPEGEEKETEAAAESIQPATDQP